MAEGVSAVRRAWLRELGIEKLWDLPGAQAAPAVEPAPGPALDPAPLAEAAPAPVSVPVSPPADADEAWTALQAEVAACTACSLCKTRTQTVFGVGPRTARWMIVGEAPGEQEDKQGAPFVGRSGQLLDNMLASIGRSRKTDVFIANVIKCRPPGNRDPEPGEVAQCSPFLMRQVELVNPDLILVLGRFAAQTLLNTDARIGSLRGTVHAVTVGDRQVPTVVSYHPAYLLRSPGEKLKAWQDLRLALSIH